MTAPGDNRQSAARQRAAEFREAAFFDPRPTFGIVLDNLVYESIRPAQPEPAQEPRDRIMPPQPEPEPPEPEI